MDCDSVWSRSVGMGGKEGNGEHTSEIHEMDLGVGLGDTDVLGERRGEERKLKLRTTRRAWQFEKKL